MKPNRLNELFYINLILNGRLKIFPYIGKVYDVKNKRFIGYINNSGYVAIGIKHESKVRHILAYRLIWIYFNGWIPYKKQINHKNGVKAKNGIKNLELTTNQENVIHAYKNKLIDINKLRQYKGVNHKNSRFKSMIIIKVIRKLREKGMTYKQLATKFKCHKRTIADIVTYKSYIE